MSAHEVAVITTLRDGRTKRAILSRHRTVAGALREAVAAKLRRARLPNPGRDRFVVARVLPDGTREEVATV